MLTQLLGGAQAQMPLSCRPCPLYLPCVSLPASLTWQLQCHTNSLKSRACGTLSSSKHLVLEPWFPTFKGFGQPG